MRYGLRVGRVAATRGRNWREAFGCVGRRRLKPSAVDLAIDEGHYVAQLSDSRGGREATRTRTQLCHILPPIRSASRLKLSSLVSPSNSFTGKIFTKKSVARAVSL